MNKTVLMRVLAVVGLPATVIAVFANVLVSAVGVWVGLLFAALYLTVGTLLFRAGPLWPNAGSLWWLSCVVWGAGVSVALVMPAATGWTSIVEKLGWSMVSASFSGAYPEEIAKAFGVVIILYAFRKLNRPWHGFVTGGLIGLGFEVHENVIYGASGALLDANSDFNGAVEMWFVRMVAGPGLHIVFTALAGWGIGLAMFRRDSLRGLWWVVLSLALHFVWNILWPSEFWLVTHYVIMTVLVYPLFIWVYWRAVREKNSDKSYVLLA
ncbi:PrsW family intramembrane metalloprotease [Corynebacterium hindlerae]|uniref:PrsW family intramembrane metalloprotease n=1 Tax=Corynebacterium hindlerae TaxID=699041 RepID=UPI001AD670E1|nr:PrsW family intramembrane metalloprotease [Corynebacterium hindlerae]QTH59703.1 PrsW family intramembrane metalloprotease [Corynebacterium hindlerae]